MWFNDVELIRTLVVALVAIPYVVEIVMQLPLLARVMRALSTTTLEVFPPHPRHPWLAVFGSARFFWALFRFALRDEPADGPEIALLKRRMRASAIREAVFGLAFWGTVITFWVRGWRPWT